MMCALHSTLPLKRLAFGARVFQTNFPLKRVGGPCKPTVMHFTSEPLCERSVFATLSFGLNGTAKRLAQTQLLGRSVSMTNHLILTDRSSAFAAHHRDSEIGTSEV